MCIDGHNAAFLFLKRTKVKRGRWDLAQQWSTINIH